MAFVRIASVDYDVLHQGASQGESTHLGLSTRAFAGNLRSSRRADKRQWRFTLGPMTSVVYSTLLTNTALGAHVNCEGDAITSGGPVLCEVTVTEAPYLSDLQQVGGYQRFATVSLLEV